MKQLFFIIAISIPLQAMAEWKAPANPDPKAILDEARTDARAGRYEDALAKYHWFHHHALQLDSSLAGVRLAPALMGWYELSKLYPPALEKLQETRDEAARKVVENKDSARQAFCDMSAINEQINQDERTAAMFVRLDKELPEVAKKCITWRNQHL